MAAKEPPTPIKARHIKSPRIKRVAKSLGPTGEKQVVWYHLCKALIPRYKEDDKNVGPRVSPMINLRIVHVGVSS